MKFNYFVLSTVFFVVSASKWDHDSLRIVTNVLDSEILNYYSKLPNEITDVALTGIRDYLINNNQTKIDIPPIDVDFAETILGFDIADVEFKAYNGVFTNPATVERKGNSHIDYHLIISSLSTSIGFTDMEVYFPRYEATVVGIQESGSVKLVISTNEIFLNVTITLLPKCTVSLTQVKLTKFEDITSDITGLGILDGLAGDITSKVLSSYETSFGSLIENIVANKLSEVLAKTGGFCKYHGQLKRKVPEKRNVTCVKLNPTRYKCQT